MTKKLIKIAKDHGAKDDIIDSLLNSHTKNYGLEMIPRKYLDIVEGEFEIEKVVRINRKNDENTISFKILDFSSETIRQLRESGYSNSKDLSDVDFS